MLLINNLLNEVEENFCETAQMVSQEFCSLADIRESYGLQPPSTFEEGIELYFIITQVLDQSIDY